MRTEISGTEKRIGAATAREVRAITEEMDISRGSDPHAGTFTVRDGDETHVVDLRANTCDCVDSRLSLPEDGDEVCAHRHRARYALRPEDIPHALREHMDRRLVRSAARYASLSVEERAPITVEERAAAVVRDSTSAVDEPDHAGDERPLVMADGGVDVEARRACEESMTVVPDAPGMFRVYSGETSVYTVDLVSGACECPAAKYQEGDCKHLRRVEMEVGIRSVPDLDRSTPADVEIMIDAREAREEPEAEPDHEPITVSDAKPTRRVMADGGVVLEDDPQESDDECDCEHFDVGALTCAECYIYEGIKEVPER